MGGAPIRDARWLWAVLGLAVVARLPRLVNRWDEVALAYSAYAAPCSEALAAGKPAEALASWVGLHPPLYALWMGIWDGLWPAPALWMLSSVLCSVLAVWVVGRVQGALAALVLATAPLQLADAAEVNNYPLAILGSALLVAGARAPLGWFLLGVAVAGWGHVLGLVAAGGVTAWRLWSPVRPGERWAVAGGSALIAAPLVAGVLRLSARSSTFSQPALDLSAWGELVVQATGWEGMVLGLLVLGGLLIRPGVHTVVWGALALAYGVALAAGAAAPHQRPYLGLFGPPAAVAVAVWVQQLSLRLPGSGRVWMVGVVACCLLRFGRTSVSEWRRVGDIYADQQQERGVDHALASTGPGDVLWLVAPALRADDDKSDHSSVLWRFPPWEAMSRSPLSHPAYAATDWLWGQPRRMRGRQVHTSTELDSGRFDAVVAEARANGQSVAVVLYDHGPATGLLERVERTVRLYAPETARFERNLGLGDDHVWLIQPEEGSGAHP